MSILLGLRKPHVHSTSFSVATGAFELSFFPSSSSSSSSSGLYTDLFIPVSVHYPDASYTLEASPDLRVERAAEDGSRVRVYK